MRKILGNLLLVLLFLAPGVVVWHRQYIYDAWVLNSYTPPAEVISLADKTTMTDKSRKIFYVAKPQLQDQKESFRQSCQSAEITIVLGCYKTPGGIFVFAVTDPRLSGVQEVTAAHEMLHAAYDRLGRKEKSRIDTLLAAEYAKLTDERIRKNIDKYRERDADVVPNELHSILGTEVATLSLELETYYGQYFIKRSSVVAFSQQYEAEFSSREAKVAAYDIQLKALKAEAGALNDTLNRQDEQITAQSNTMEGYKASGANAQHNALVPSFNALVRSYNANVTLLKAKIAKFNILKDERNAIVTEEQELMQAIDTRVPDTK